jgi:hypothetical protein
MSVVVLSPRLYCLTFVCCWVLHVRSSEYFHSRIRGFLVGVEPRYVNETFTYEPQKKFEIPDVPLKKLWRPFCHHHIFFVTYMPLLLELRVTEGNQ